jgi:hypothetical protein
MPDLAFTKLPRGVTASHLPPIAAARRTLSRLRENPRPLERPVLVFNGYRSLSPLVASVVRTLAGATSGKPEDFVLLSYATAGTFEGALKIVSRKLRKRLGDRFERLDFDAVGISMGGLVARLCAITPGQRPAGGAETCPRLRIQRLFTFGTPHQGSKLAAKIAPDRAARDMKPGSPVLRTLSDLRTPLPRELHCYAQLRDTFVDPRAAAPPGRIAIWSAGTRTMSHFTTPVNPWFVADVALRLRGEAPLLQEPTRPPPLESA